MSFTQKNAPGSTSYAYHTHRGRQTLSRQPSTSAGRGTAPIAASSHETVRATSE